MSTSAQQTGLDALLADPAALAGRRYALLAHGAAVSAALEPAHLALSRAAHPPALLLGPEHGYYGVEQDMVASRDERRSVDRRHRPLALRRERRLARTLSVASSPDSTW